MNPNNQYYASSIRNSYGYQDQPNYRYNEQIKTFQPYNPNNIHEIMQSRVDGIEAIIKQKKTVNNLPQNIQKNPSFQNNNQQIKYSVNSINNNNYNYQNNYDDKPNQLRGSCPNIFKKLDQQPNSLRSTTQFINLSKYGINNNEINKKQTIIINNQQQNQTNNNIPRIMKKVQNQFLRYDNQFVNNNNMNINTNFNINQINSNTNNSNTNINTNININSTNNNEQQSFLKVKNEIQFNSFKSLSNQNGSSIKFNPKQIFDKQILKKNDADNFQSPVKQINLNRTPNKIQNSFVNQYNKKTPQTSIKSSTNTLSPDNEMKKFNSLNQIWQNKQKQKTNKKIIQGIKSNSLQKSKIINGFQLGKVLGKGKFGQVFLARHQQTGFIAAIKKIVKSKVKQYKMIQQFSKQIKLHNALDQPNIVKFFGFFQQNDQIFLVMQYMNGGTLFDYLNQVYHLAVKQTIQFLRDIIQAIVYLHEKSIAHRDIKPENIVISTEGVAKLCDFGWSAVVQTSRKTYCGTFDYAPPQILQRKSYDMSVDVWCIGVLTYQLLTGRVPFQGEKRNQIMEKIVNVDKIKFQYPVQLPQQAKDFIQLLVQKDPNLRPKANELLKHPFFALCPPKVKSKKMP